MIGSSQGDRSALPARDHAVRYRAGRLLRSARHAPFVKSHHVHDGELEPLTSVDGHETNGIDALRSLGQLAEIPLVGELDQTPDAVESALNGKSRSWR